MKLQREDKAEGREARGVRGDSAGSGLPLGLPGGENADLTESVNFNAVSESDIGEPL